MNTSKQKSRQLKHTTARLLPVLVSFTLIGGIYSLNRSHAATYASKAEAESGRLAGMASPISIADASDGIGVRFGATGTEPGGRVLTVAKTGAAYKSVQSAAAASRPGDTVLIAGGTYSEALNPPSGIEGQPITFKARPGQKVIINGNKTNQSGSGLLNLDTRSWLNFVGLTFDRSPSHGIYGFQAHDITFQDCEVSHSSDGGLVLLGSNNIIVNNCSVHDNNDLGENSSHEAITMGESTTNYEIMHSSVHDNSKQGIEAKFDSNNGSIHDNVIYNNHESNVYANSVSNVSIYNNTIYSVQADKKTGIVVGIEDASSSRNSTKIQIYNNILYNNLDGGIAFSRQSNGRISKVVILNNTIVNNQAGGIVGINELAADGNIARNNIFFTNSSGVGYPLSNDSNFTQDPTFVNAAGHDFHLSNGSGALNGGSPTDAPAFDHDNKTRPLSGRVDIGAYEQ